MRGEGGEWKGGREGGREGEEGETRGGFHSNEYLGYSFICGLHVHDMCMLLLSFHTMYYGFVGILWDRTMH